MGLSAPFGQEFRFNNDRTTGNLYDFLHVLQHLPREDFKHHVNEDRHDFATWIEHSLREGRLARKVERQRSKSEVVRTLYKFLYF